MSQQVRSAFVVSEASEIVQALVGLKDVQVLHYARRGRDVELVIEQVVNDPRCPGCGGPARVKERPLVRYVDLPVYGTAMRLGWRKHRMRCPDRDCPDVVGCSAIIGSQRSPVCSRPRAAKWATVQVSTGRTVSEVARELDCDWHTVNDGVTTYGQALLTADRRRLNRTAAIGLDETSFVRLADHHTSYVTTVCDVEHHQIIDILPSRDFVDVAGFLNKQPTAWKQRVRYGALDMSATYAAVFTVVLPKAAQVVD